MNKKFWSLLCLLALLVPLAACNGGETEEVPLEEAPMEEAPAE